MPEVFISYKQEERERMRPIANALLAAGVDVWFDAYLEPGKSFTEEIVQEIETCRAQIVCWSPAAVRSEWVRGEADIGRQRGVLVSVMIEPCRLVPPFNMLHAENLIGWRGDPLHEGWQKILRTLATYLGRELITASSPTADFSKREAVEILMPEMAQIPRGEFNMGAPKGEPNSDDEERPQHKVGIRAFEFGKYPVTFEEWDAALSAGAPLHRPNDLAGRGRRPVVSVSWFDAKAYIAWLNEKTSQQYRLPSEAEWEYACRASTASPYSTGDAIGSTQACFNGSPIAPVGSYPPNRFGLFDMHGNVREWTEDCWHRDYKGAPTDGSAWTSEGDCSLRVRRGGSWRSKPEGLRSACRNGDPPDKRSSLCGFRLARSIEPK